LKYGETSLETSGYLLSINNQREINTNIIDDDKECYHKPVRDGDINHKAFESKDDTGN